MILEINLRRYKTVAREIHLVEKITLAPILKTKDPQKLRRFKTKLEGFNKAFFDDERIKIRGFGSFANRN
jgi:hypothetical protein